MFRKMVLASAVGITVALCGCATPKEGTVNSTTKEIEDLRAKTQESPVIQSKADYYVDSEPLPLEDREPWLKSPVTLNAHDLPFSAVVDRVLKDVAPGHQASYALDMEASRPLSLTYSGTVKGLFDHLQRLTGFRFEVRNGRVCWTEYLTKTFDVLLASGDESFRMGRQDATTSGGAGGGGSGIPNGAPGGGTSQMTTISSGSNTSEFVSKLSKSSVWTDLEKNVKALLSDKGTVMVSQAMSTVTVRDRADRVELVEGLLDGVNRNLGAQVLIRVRILELTLSKDYQYGIDWNIVKQRTAGKLSFGTTANLPTPAVNTSPATLLYTLTDPASSLLGSSALIKALATQGDVSVVTQPEVIAVNNRVSEVRLENQTSFLASVSVTTTANVGSSSSLTPGVVIDGFSMYLLPRVVGSQVVLTVSSNISTLQGISQVSSNGSTIQTPELASKEIYQNAIMGSGETLVLTGFRQLKESKNADKLFGTPLLGGRSKTNQRTELIFLITPVVLGSKS